MLASSKGNLLLTFRLFIGMSALFKVIEQMKGNSLAYALTALRSAVVYVSGMEYGQSLFILCFSLHPFRISFLFSLFSLFLRSFFLFLSFLFFSYFSPFLTFVLQQ